MVAFLFFTGMVCQGQSFRLGTHLQSNMVVQQNKPLVVWGDAAPFLKYRQTGQEAGKLIRLI